MKKVYVPKGETVQFNELSTETVIVNGHLKVLGKLTAKRIQGKGTVEAIHVVSDTIAVDTLTVGHVTAQKIAVKKLLLASDCRAHEIVVTDFIEANHVQAHKLSMTLSSIEVCEADEIITLPQKRHGMLGMLFAAWWRCLFLPGKATAKAAKPHTEKPNQPTQPEVPLVSNAEPVISEDFLDALIDRLEARAFVYDAPYTDAGGFPFRKEQEVA